MNEWEKYKGREQSYVKHYVLKHYLQSLTYKLALGIKKPQLVLTYIDGFLGHGNPVLKILLILL